MSKLLKEQWAKLAFGQEKQNDSVNEGLWATLTGRGSQSIPPWLSFAAAYASCSPEAQAIVQSLSMQGEEERDMYLEQDIDSAAAKEAYDKLYDSLREIYDSESSELAAALESLVHQ